MRSACSARRPATLHRMESISTFRRIAIAEATSFLLLLTATVIKYSADQSIGVRILGPIHGLLFLGYVFLALNLSRPAGWSRRTTLLVLLGAVVPFGGFVVERRIARAT